MREEYSKVLRPYLVQGDKAHAINTTVWFWLFILLCGVPYFFLSSVSRPVEAAVISTEQIGVTFSAIQTEIYNTAFPVTDTPVPTQTLIPTQTSVYTSTPDLPVMDFLLSFYDPRIGYFFPEIAEVNCLQWDYVNRDCLSKVNNGTEDYRLYYGKGVACPPPLRDGQRIRVLSPVELVNISRDWICIDRGDLVQDYYLDFMLRYPDMIWTGENLWDFPWNATVSVEVLP